MPVYVPKFHSGWEPPLDVFQEAPWEVEGLASAPDDEVRALMAPPQTGLPSSATAHLLSPLPSPHTKPRWPFFPAADSREPIILPKLPQTQPCI